MTVQRRVAGAVVALVGAVAIAGLSRVPVSSESGAALLRLSWRIQPEREEVCRERTAEELEALAPHMRTPLVCTGTSADYELRVRVEGEEIVRDTIRARGVRGEQPLYVYQDVPLRTGTHAVDVMFGPLRERDEDDDEPEEREEREERREAESEAASYSWEGTVDLGEGDIALITLGSGGLELRRRAP
jgi:hypothetical protein